MIPYYSILKYSIARIFFFKYPGYPGDSNSNSIIPKKEVYWLGRVWPINVITENACLFDPLFDVTNSVLNLLYII